MGVEDEVGRLATVAADKSKKEGIEEVPTTILDPPQAGGVTVETEIDKQRPKQNAGIMASVENGGRQCRSANNIL